MQLPFLTKVENLPLEKRNQRLARDLIFLFAFNSEHRSVVQITFNHIEITIHEERVKLSLRELNREESQEHPSKDALQIKGELSDIFSSNVNGKIKKKIDKMMKKHHAYYHVEQIGSSERSVITINYK